MPHRLTGVVVSLLSVLLQLNSSLSFSLSSCTVRFSGYSSGVSVDCADRELAVVPDDVPKNANQLHLIRNNLVKIDRTDLSGLSQLVHLDLQSNMIAHIDDGAFADLEELTELLMTSNVVTNLTDGMFLGLFKLELLTLAMNQISCIPPLAFRPLISLQKVDLDKNKLHQISDIVPILLLPNLQELAVIQNLFTSLESDDLPFNRSNLTRFLFASNPLKKFSITRDVFPRLEFLSLSTCSPGLQWDVPDQNFLRSLKTLYLNGSEMSFEMYSAVLQRTESLEYLSLSYVKDYFDKGLIDVACHIPSLTRLDLKNNKFYILNDTLLQPCSNITQLSLSRNEMTDLSEESLRGLNQLQKLQLDTNLLSRVPPALRGLSTLLILSLSHNDIPELGCSDFLNLTTLTDLILSHNRISKLRGCVFQDLKNLRSLDIEENPIIHVYDTFSVSLQNLRRLDMNKNHFKKISKGVFGTLSSLELLDFQSVSEQTLDDGVFEGLDCLQNLILTAYFFRKDTLRGLPRLKYLTLYLSFDMRTSRYKFYYEPPFLNVPTLKTLRINNVNRYFMVIAPDLFRGLKDLEIFMSERFFYETPHPDTFTYTPRLTALEIINSNILDPEPELFQPIPNLRTLDLSKNKLRSLDFLSRANLSALGYLKLTENELTVIDETVFRSLPALTYLDLSGNPFTCDCANVGFIQWVKNNSRTQVANGHQYNCAFPQSKQGTKLLDFDVQSCWMDVSFLCFLSSSCLTLLTLLTSFVYHFLRWQLVYAYRLFLAYLYDSRKRKKGAPHLYDAFVSYNVHDEAWVYGEMLPVLEGEQGWKLCLHHRDFQPGRPVIDNITDAIYSSRKTICVVSQRYLQSHWCSTEIQMASFRLFDERTDVLILLFLEEIPAGRLSPFHRLRKLVKRRTYLSWPRAGRHPEVFWQNVRRALEPGDAPIETTDLLAPRLPPDLN